jgi:uncharacterized protein (UPF0332 family)
MKDSDFLAKLLAEGRIGLVEPSKEIADSYMIKCANCLKSAKILLENQLFENSVSEAYFSMYNATLSLFFRCGIKCESHTGAVLLLKLAFGREALHSQLKIAKTERIDKQYYVVNLDAAPITRALSQDMVKSAESYVLAIRVYAERLNPESIDKIRAKLE